MEQRIKDYATKIATDIFEDSRYDILSKYKDEEEVYEHLYNCVDNYESYSPWEFFAKELNESEDPDHYWELYRGTIDETFTCLFENLKEEEGVTY